MRKGMHAAPDAQAARKLEHRTMKNLIQLFAVLIVGVPSLLLCGCSKLTGNNCLDRSVGPDTEFFLAALTTDCFRYKKAYIVTGALPELSNLSTGMPSRVAFQTLGKATAASIEIRETPPPESCDGGSPDNLAIKYTTRALWRLAELRGDSVELMAVTIRFSRTVPASVSTDSLGHPLHPESDQGWTIDRIELTRDTGHK